MRLILLIALAVILVHDSYLAKYTVYTNNVMMAGHDHVRTAPRVATFAECMKLIHSYNILDRRDSYVLKPKGGRTFSCVKETWAHSLTHDLIEPVMEEWHEQMNPPSIPDYRTY